MPLLLVLLLLVLLLLVLLLLVLLLLVLLLLVLLLLVPLLLVLLLLVLRDGKSGSGELLSSFLNSCWMITRKFSVLMATLLYIVGSCARHSQLTEEMSILLRPTPREDSLVLTFL